MSFEARTYLNVILSQDVPFTIRNANGRRRQYGQFITLETISANRTGMRKLRQNIKCITVFKHYKTVQLPNVPGIRLAF